MKHRKLLTIVGTAFLTLGITVTALAGVWKQDDIGWWYQEGDGSYPVDTWKWIDGNNDGVEECYYFDSTGYLLTSITTLDGYQVNENGAWIVGSDVQRKKTEIYAEISDLYTYKEMQRDLSQLQGRFPEVPIEVESLAQTIDEREVYHIVVGEESASKHILITGAIHAREYITAQLVMKQLLDVCYRYPEYVQMDDTVAFHFVPMVNPDGVTISQLGLDGIKREDIRQTVLQIIQNDSAKNLSEHLIQWKANARGVDLNRNFDALWENYKIGPKIPSSYRYKGTAPHSEVESKALVDLTERIDFDATINYHTQGEVIYWYFEQSDTLLVENRKLADLGSRCTGYKIIENDPSQDGLGYKDWAIQKKGIPGLTIEVGRGENPVPHDQMPGIWEQNKNLLAMLLQEFL